MRFSTTATLSLKRPPESRAIASACSQTWDFSMRRVLTRNRWSMTFKNTGAGGSMRPCSIGSRSPRIKKSNGSVTLAAKKLSIDVGRVVVVHFQRSGLGLPTTDCAHPALFSKHRVALISGHPEMSARSGRFRADKTLNKLLAELEKLAEAGPGGPRDFLQRWRFLCDRRGRGAHQPRHPVRRRIVMRFLRALRR